MEEEDQNDEYIEDVDQMEDEDVDEDEDMDEVDEAGIKINSNFKFPPRQVIGNQFIDAKGRPQSAKVQGKGFGGGIRGFQQKREDGQPISYDGKYPVQAYQQKMHNPQGNSYNYPADALNMIRATSGKSKRPMSASNMARSGRNVGGEQAVVATLTAQNSKLPTEISRMDIKRMRPNKITQEKEKLYEQAIRFKIQMNAFKEENLKLKTRLKFLEKEQQEKEGIIENLAWNNEITTIGRIGNIVNKKKNESYLATALKRQIKELKQSLSDKEGEVLALK